MKTKKFFALLMAFCMALQFLPSELHVMPTVNAGEADIHYYTVAGMWTGGDYIDTMDEVFTANADNTIGISAYKEDLTQIFRLVALPGKSEYFYIISVKTGKVLTVLDGTQALSWADKSKMNDDYRQHWSKAAYVQNIYVDSSGGLDTAIQNRATGNYISSAPDLSLIQKAPTDNDVGQQWAIIEVDYESILRGPSIPDTSTAQLWRENAIVSPLKNELNPAGPVEVKWRNANTFSTGVTGYKIYLDGWHLDTISQTNQEYVTYDDLYIVDVAKHTIRVEVMGGNTVSSEIEFFISKKGIAYWASLNNLQDMGLSWYYNWRWSPTISYDYKQWEFVPMIWGDPAENRWLAQGSDWLADPKNRKYKTVLGFNEPDHEMQALMSVQRAASLWPNFVNSGLRLGSPSVAYNYDGWLNPFLATVNNNVDFIAIHIYYGAADPNGFKNNVISLHNKYPNKPIWITEFALANWSGNQSWSRQSVYNFMAEVLPWLDSQNYIERYSWFPFEPNDRCGGNSGLFDHATGELLDLGKLYRRLGNPQGYKLPDLRPARTLGPPDPYETVGNVSDQTVKKAAQNTPAKPVLHKKTTTGVNLKAVVGAEYSKDQKKWQSSPVFKGLKPNTTYKFYIRLKATDTKNVSPVSAALSVKTNQAVAAAPKANKKAGSYKGKVKVKLSSATKGTKICYTTNGKKPTVRSKYVKSGKCITIKKNTVLKFMSTARGYKNSKVITIRYTIQAKRQPLR